MSEIALTPLRIGRLEIKNRIFRPPHGTHMSAGGSIDEQFIAYHEARARGGAGLIVIEGTMVHPSSYAPRSTSLLDDQAIEGFAALKKRIAPYGTKIFVQLWHAGHNLPGRDGSPPWSSSPTTGMYVATPAIEMTRSMIEEVINAYAEAARRAAQAGLDGVEFHAAHGYLPRQFLASALNWRTDEYGGPFENRVRFIVEAMQALRRATPAEMVVGIRLGPDVLPGLSDLEENVAVVNRLERENLLDYVSFSLGEYFAALGSSAMEAPSGYELPYLQGARAKISVPLLATGRFRTVDEASSAIRAGDADMIGMVRAMIADPDIVMKTINGDAERVRPCIACNQLCIGGVMVGGSLGCSVNPLVGKEASEGEILKPATRPRKVVVVGGGVAGMEAARVAALRGHSVVLHEAQPHLGGKVRFVAARAPMMGAFGDIAFWQESELRRLNVDVRTNSYIDAEDLQAEDADVVVIAVGATPGAHIVQRQQPGHRLQGLDGLNVYTSTDVLAAKEGLGDKAVVFDDVGHYEAIAVAEYLLKAGLKVTFLTRFTSFAPLVEGLFRSGPAFERMNRTGRFSLRTRALIDRIGAKSVIVFDPRVDPAPSEIEADAVVLVTYNEPNSDLARSLEGRGFEVKVIGDALSPRYIDAAIHGGFWAAAGV